MDRRGLLGLLLGFVPALAMAQTTPPAAMPPVATPPARDRRRMASLSFEEMTPRQRRTAQQRLAGTGRSPMAPEEARRAWDGMTPRQRREATRKPDSSADRPRQPPTRPPQ